MPPDSVPSTERGSVPGSAALIAKAVDDLDKVSRRLSRAGGMAIAAGLTDLVDLIGEAGCDIDTVINDLEDAAPDAD